MNTKIKEWPGKRQDFKTVEKEISLATDSLSTTQKETSSEAVSIASTLEEQPLSVNETETSHCPHSQPDSDEIPPYAIYKDGFEITTLCEDCFHSLLDEAAAPCLSKPLASFKKEELILEVELEKEKINPGYHLERCEHCREVTYKGVGGTLSLYSEEKAGNRVGPLCDQCYEDLIDQGVIPCPFSGFLDPERER